jgi:PAS domain S-box-containing protein
MKREAREGDFMGQGKAKIASPGKHPEKNIIRNNDITKVLFEETPLIYWTTDASLRFITIGGHGRFFSQIKTQWRKGKTLYDYFTPQQKSMHVAIKAHLSALKGKVVRYDYFFDHFTLDVLAQPLRDEKGHIVGVTGYAMDITETRHARKEHETFQRVSQKLIGYLTLRNLADILSQESRLLFDHHSFAFFLYYKEKNQLFTVLAEDTPPGGKKPVVFEREKTKALSASKIRNLIKKPTLINRKKEPVESPFDPFGFKSRRSRSIMILPICWENKIVGALEIGSYIPDKYNKRDLETLKSLANLCSGSVARIKIKESLRLNRYAIDSSINAIAMVNLDGMLSYVNPAFLSLWDYESAKPVSRKPFFRFWKNKKEVGNLLRDTKSNGWWMGEMAALRSDGSVFDSMVSSNLVYDDFQNPSHIMFFIQDVTSRNLSEKALRMAHYSIERVRDAIFWVSPKSRFIYANDAACSLFGYSREEFLSMKVSDIDPPYKGRMWKMRWENLKKEKSALSERSLRKKDGSFIPVELCLNYLKVENHEFLYSVIRDISIRKHSEEELKKAHEIYRKVIRNDNGIPYICHFNEGVYEFFCGEEVELAGIPLCNFTVETFKKYISEIVVTDPEAPSDPREYGGDFRKGLIERYRADYKIINPRGEELWLSDCSLPMRDPETGRVTGSFGILHDITFRKRTEKEREALQRLSHKLTIHLDKEEFGRILAEESREIFHHDAFWFSLYDESDNFFREVYVEDTPQGKKYPVPIPFDGVLKLGRIKPIYLDGKPKIVNRDRIPLKSKLIPFGLKKQYSLSMMFAPVVWKGKVLGVLSVQSYTPDRYNERDLKLLQSFADHCAGALTRVTFYEELEIKNQAIANSLTPINLVDLEGRVIYSNRSVMKLWDYDDLSDVVGKHYTHFFKNDKKAREANEQIVNQGEWIGELTAVRQDGSTFDVRITASLIRDDKGAPLCIMGAFCDLSQIRLTDKALHFAQYTLDNMADVVIWFYPDGSLFYINEAGCRLLGYSLDELLDMKISQIDPNYNDIEISRKFALLKKKKYMVKETTWKTKNGEILPIEVSVNYLEYDGRNLGCAFARDISYRKMAEQAVKDSDEKYRILVENAGAIIASFNEEGVLLSINRTAASVLGGKPRDFLGKTMWDLFPRETADYHMDNIRQVIHSGMAVSTQYLSMIQDKEIWYDVNIPPIVDSRGKVTGALVIAMDITDQKKVQRNLEESQTDLQSMKMMYQAILRATPFGLCMLSPEWKVIWTNPALKAILDPENLKPELANVSFKEFLGHEVDFREYLKSVRNNIKNSGCDQRKIALLRTDGSQVLCDISLVRVDPAKTAPGFVATVIPVSE